VEERSAASACQNRGRNGGVGAQALRAKEGKGGVRYGAGAGAR
jgi:hypothetical protein